MASDFLKNMAQQRAELADKAYGEDAYGGSKWRQQQNTRNTRSSTGGTQQTVPTNMGAASSFLQDKAKEAKKRIDAQFGPDAYGGSNYRFGEARRQDTAERTTPATASTQRRTTAGGYYSMPDFGADSERLESAARTAQTAMKQKEAELEQAYSAMTELEKSAQFYGQQAQNIYETYLQNQDPGWGTIFERASANYQKANQEYSAAADAFNAVYAEYEPLLNAYNQAAEEYNTYMGSQQEQYSAWRGTIRSQDVIQQDIDAADARIAELEQKQRELNSSNQALTSGISRARMYGPVDTMETRLAQQQEQAAAIGAQIENLQQDKALLQEEMEWSQYFGYADLMQAEDFGELSQYRSTANGREPEFNAWSGMYTETGFDDINYDIINRNEEAMSHQMVNDVSTNASFLGLDNSERGQMTDDEIAIFNYLYAQDTARGDTEHSTAYAYIDYLTSDLNYRKRQADEAQWAAYARESPVGSSVFSVITSPLKGLSYLGQAADYLEDREIDQNAGYNRFSYINTAIRDEVTGIVEEKWGGVGSFAYSTGMSMADFLFNAAVAGGNQGVALAIMGTGAAADATISAKDRGLSDDQAFALGTIAGAAEIITEKFSLDALFKGSWDEGAIKYILRNAFTEGSEEVASDTINLFADILIAKDKSEWQTAIDAYMEQGKSESEAFGLALGDQAAQMGLDFLGGAISGGIMSSVNVGVNRAVGAIDSRRQQNQEATQEQAEAMEQADNMAEEYLQRESAEQAEAEGITLPTAEQLEQQGQREQGIRTDVETEIAEDAGVVLPTAVQEERQTGQTGQAIQTEEAVDTTTEPGMLPTAEQMEVQQRMERAGTDLERSGIQAGAREENIQTAQRLSDILGRNIRFYDGGTRQDASAGANGYYSGDTIYVNSRSRNPVAQIISHELTHSVETADAYDDLADLVLNRIQQTGGNLEQLRREKAELYASRGAQLASQEEIDQEIVAQYVERYLLTDEQSIRELTQQNRSLGQRILSWLNQLLAKLGNGNAQERVFVERARNAYARALQQTQSSFTQQTEQAAPAARQSTQQTTGPPIMEGGGTAQAQEQQTQQARAAQETGRPAPEAAQERRRGRSEQQVQEDDQRAQRRRSEAQDALEGLRRDYAEGRITEEEFDAALDAIMEEEGLAGEEMLEQYSIDENYERDIDDWDAQGRPDGEVFILGSTGDVLQGLGAMEQDIYLRSEKVNAILEQHPEMTLEEIKRIPEILDDPVLVLKSRNVGRGGYENSRMVIFGTVTAQDGRPVLVALDLMPTEGRLRVDDMQKVTSAYTKDTNPVGFLTRSEVLYADKKRTAALLRRVGFQMPTGLLRSGSMGSITYGSNTVNMQGVPFDQVVDTTQQQEDGRQYSFGGRNANAADLDALNRAQELERQGVAMDTIFRETGWYTGADGKWRFEIDDSGMEYSRWGDLQREDRAEFARFRELEGKFIDGSITMDEQNELRQLLEQGHGAGRAEEQQALRLADFLRHDELYQNYPQLRQAGLRFARLQEGTRGTFDGQDIILDESLRSAPEDTLMHEIQHAIQRAEGFTGGASPEGWQAVRQQVIDTVAGARQNLDLWLQDIGYPEYVRESMQRVVSGEITLDEHWKALEEFKKDSPFAAEIARCEEELAGYENQLRMLNNLGDGEWANSFDMYENTAGEIEARDVTARRQMTPEQRRETMPNTGDERTVYAETMQELGSEYGMWDTMPEKRQFSMSEPVEQTRDLLALHNLTPEKLRSTLKLGGFPMPSIAVIRDQMQHDNYGEITMVFGKDTIDPQADSRNRVYGGDAWTPTAPRVDYPINYETQRAFEDRVEHLAANVAGGTFNRASVLGTMGITGDSTDMGMEEIIRRLANDNAVQAAYLADQGQNVEPVMKTKQFDSYGNDTLQRYAESMDIQELADIAARIDAGGTMTDEEISRAKEFIREAMQARGGFNTSPQRIEMRMSKVTDERVERFAQHAWEYLQDNGATTDEVDYYATRDALEAAVDKQAVADWARRQLNGLLGEPGIYNGRDPFTPAGRSRSFEQLHYPYTLENLVRAMSTTQEARGEGLWGATAKGLQSVSTPEYQNVDEIHADEGRLQNLSQEEYDALLKDVDDGIEEVIEAVRSTNTAHSSNRWEEADIIGSVLIDAARGRHTPAAVERAFRKEDYTISRELAKQIVGLFNQAANVPTGYFEAKPQRAVPLNEILAAVVPDTMDAELRAELEGAGVPTITYPEGDTQRRMEAVNSVEGAKFSIDEGLEERGRTRDDRQEIMAQLRRYVSGDITTAQLRRYLDDVDASGETMDTSAAQEIVDNAHREGLSVDEYLRQNWELYEYDGGLNEEARQALELERAQARRRYSIEDDERVFFTPRGVEVVQNPTTQEYQQMRDEAYQDYPWLRGTGEPVLRHTYDRAGNEYYWRADQAVHAQVEPYINEHYGTQTSQQWQWWTRDDADEWPTDYERQYSVDEEAQLPTAEETERDIISTMPVKAQQYLRRAERYLLDKVGGLLNVPRYAKREYLQDIVREISLEYLREGRVSEDTVDSLFERAYDEGVVVEREFYDQYADLRNYLRTTRLTIAPEDSADIADFNDFRKSNFGRLNISTQGGTNIDQVYQELADMWPEFFNEERHSHPADQLLHIADVAQSFQVAEKSLDEYYGPEAEEFRRWARHDFEAAVYDAVSELRSVRRYVEDRAAQAGVEAPPTTQAEVTEMWGRLKDARRTYEKAAARNLLTEHDEVQVGRLLRGEIELEHLDPERDNVRGVTAVYEAKQEYERLTRLIRQWNQSRKAALRQQADRYLQTANDWKDKKAGILYSRETMERNIRDIVNDETLAEEINKTYFTPVHDAAAAANRMKNQYRDRVRELNLSRNVAKGNVVSEAHAVQLLGEAEDNIRMLEQSRGRMKARDGKSLEDWRGVVDDLWAENPNLDADKIRAAVAQFRTIYDELFQQMNEVRVRNGYEPVNYRRGYFPHFQPGNGDGILAQFGKALGIDTEVTALPTTINGLTHTFRPGIRWFGNAQERMGFNTAYDAVEGFDRYIEGVADVIHQTDNIQRLRALASQMRYRTGDEGIRKQVDAVVADPNLTEQDKQNRIEKIYETGRYTLSNFVVELEEYTNLLANKKSRADRNMEQALGRNMYNLVKALESRVAANMVAVNPASWLTNFIPLTQGGALLDRGMLLKGMWDTLKAYKVDDGIVDKSSFLTNRRGSDPIVKTWAQRASATASRPMEYIDQFVADSLVRARYRQNLGKNMSEDAAMAEADAFAASVMADRSKGATPTLFNRSNPLTKVFTQFQLEVNNQLSYLFKDMPRDTRDKGIAALAAALLKFFLGAWLFDELYEYVIGRRPGLDPIGILNDAVGDLTGYELPNLVELGVGAASGNIPSFQVEQAGLTEAGANLAGSALEQLPFIGGVLGGGRVPISSAIPDIGNLWNALTNEDWSTGKRLQEVRDELLEKPLVYLGLPFGGGQLKKIYEGIEGVIQGGSYSVNAEGEQELQYPIYNDTAGQAIGNALLAAVFGRTSLPTGREWIESGFKTLGAKQTAVYQGMLEAGVPGEEAYALLEQLQGAEKTETESEAAQERKLLEESSISGDGKSIVYYGLMATDRERELMDDLADEDADMGEVTTALMAIKDAGALKGAAASNAKRDAIAAAALSEDEQIQLYNYTFGEKQDDGSYVSSRAGDIDAFASAGLSFEQFLEAQNEYSTINEQYDSSGEKAVEFARWVNNQGLTEEQAAVVKDAFTYYSQIPQSGGYYEKFVAAGLNDQSAYDLNEALDSLEPPEGEDQVTSLQRYQAVVGAGLTESEQMTAMEELMPETEYEKLRAGSLQGVTPRAYVSYKQALPLYDADGNGSFKQEEVQAALDSLPLTTAQKAALWQMQNKSWKPQNNPYSVSVSQQVYDALNTEDGELTDWSGELTNWGGITLPTAEEAAGTGLKNWN